jgi:hypothetical protein
MEIVTQIRFCDFSINEHLQQLNTDIIPEDNHSTKHMTIYRQWYELSYLPCS